MIIGKVKKIGRVEVTYDGKLAMAGYSEDEADEGVDAKISFIPQCKKPRLIKQLYIDGREASIVKAYRSLYINDMWNFQITFIEV